jgi:hypothetical protein
MKTRKNETRKTSILWTVLKFIGIGLLCVVNPLTPLFLMDLE